jgi:hypothetical protein
MTSVGNRKDSFFSQKNESMIEKLLVSDFNRRIGTDLNESQKTALEKRVKYYMGNVFYDGQNADASLQDMNKQVLQSVVPDFLGYLKRPTRPKTEVEMDRIRNDVSSRFDSMQQERNTGPAALPAAPNFQMTLEDNYAPTLARLEELRKERQMEATAYESSLENRAAPVAKMPDDMKQRIESDDKFRESSNAYLKNDADTLALRESTRRARNEPNQVVDVLPDPRRAFFGETDAFGQRLNGFIPNPTIVPQSNRTSLPQDIIKPQADVLEYKDNEYNLFIYSADRDWVNNTAENRYNFSVNFDPANNRSGFGLSPSTYIKFKNIARIELVKVIMATEGFETLAAKTSTTVYDTDASINVLSYPYLQVRIDELNTNGFGTNDGLNNSFGVISYEAYWASDSNLKNRGYTRMVPKFLKCQKIYYPTPLATLQKMTIQIQKPDGSILNRSQDALDISGIVTSAQLATGGSPPTTPVSPWEPSGASSVSVTGTNYYDTSGEYLWIQTKSWFSQFNITQGDRLVFKNVVFPPTFPQTTTAPVDFLNYINRPEGHIVVDIAQAYLASSKLTFATGSNKVGYSNFIIIRNNFNDPTTGSSSLVNYGGTTAANNAFLSALAAAPGLASGRLLNMSHQIQMIFRVITRDMDSATRLRPDNL